MGFWETVAGQTLAWSAATAAVATAVKGLLYLVERGVTGFRHLHRAGRAIKKLAAIGNEDAWPNGSTDLPTLLDGLHTNQQKILKWQEDHDTRHIDLEAIETRQR